jgi:predicted permease
MAMAVVLLIGAGLMIRSLAKIWSVNPGFDPHHLLTFGLSSAKPLGSTPDEVRAAFRQLEQRTEAIPGVEAMSLTAGAMPMSGDSELPFWRAGEPKPTSQMEMKEALFYAVQPDYLKAMRTPLLRGRFLNEQDNEHSRFVIVIDQQFAKLYFGGEDPIGQQVNFAILNKSAEIVGVVGHVKQWGLDRDATGPVQAQFYFPLSQIPDNVMPLLARGVGVVVRTQGSPQAQVGAIRHGLNQINSQLVMYGTESMEDIIADSLAARRFSMILLGVFAGLALVLSCVGIYGVISYLVGQRRHEIGIRMALGAQQSDVLRMILGEGARMALLGVGAGLLAALGLTRLMAKMLFGVSSYDPLTFGGVAAVLVVVALAACYRPARRATRIDPAISLRYE